MGGGVQKSYIWTARQKLHKTIVAPLQYYGKIQFGKQQLHKLKQSSRSGSSEIKEQKSDAEITDLLAKGYKGVSYRLILYRACNLLRL